MRHKNFNVLGILFLFGIVLFSMSFVSAEVTNFTILNPVANANITGTFTVIANVTNITGALNVSVRWWNGTLGNWAILCANASVATNGNYTCALSTSALNANVSSSIFNVTAVETDGVAANSTNITGIVIDNSIPATLLIGYTNDTKKSNTNITLNISVVDINMTRQSPFCIVDVNGTNQTLALTAIDASSGTCNSTNVSLKGLIDGRYTIKVYTGRNSTYWNANLTGVNSSGVVFVDSNGPTVELTTTDITKDTITLAITATDGTGTGVSSCTADRTGATVSGTTSLTESGLGCAGSYTYVVTCTDGNSLTASATKTVSTNACGGSAGSGSSGASKPVVNTVSEIKPGVASVTKFTDAATGVKQIEITVNNPAQSVQITVTKYDGKPAAVSVVKSGTVYQYVQISTQNLADKLANAKVQFQVEKSKVSDKNKVVVSKFDETGKKWNDLSTTFASEDSKFYYYDVEVSSFSYFAISESALVAGDNTAGNGTGSDGTGSTSSLIWLWIVIGLVVLALLIWAVVRKK